MENLYKYIQKLESNKSGLLDLYNYLIKFSDAPGSSNNHQNWEGGYIDHIIECLEYAEKIFPIILQRDINFNLSDVFIVLLLHDIEKPLKYSKNSSTISMSNDEIRNKLISKFKINLSSDQLLALKYIHGEGSDYNKNKRVMNELGAFCHCCDIISSRIFYNYPKK